mmetsp:Transcript_34022/g.78502  ORF Transcript_34022/g.78502 Transcript_34022/m.78502 type:complete len:399 (-) Transcript_34022:38-1234(-)
MCLLHRLLLVDLSHNVLLALPEHVGCLSSLVHLDLSHNQLQELPVSFGDLPALEMLGLSSNGIARFPLPLCRLGATLQSLDISCNQLRYLPAECSRLLSLRYLNLRRNFLQSLPLVFVQVLENLEHNVDLTDNPFGEIPAKWNSSNFNNGDVAGTNLAGYSPQDLARWMREEMVFYDAAREEWEENWAEGKGNCIDDTRSPAIFDVFLHGDARSNAKGVLRRLHISAEEVALPERQQLIANLRRFYFHCNRVGVAPVHEETEDDKRIERETLREKVMIRRSQAAARVSEAHELRRTRDHNFYLKDIRGKMEEAKARLQGKAAQERRQLAAEATRTKLVAECRLREARWRDEEEGRRREKAAAAAMFAVEINGILREKKIMSQSRTLPMELNLCWDRDA